MNAVPDRGGKNRGLVPSSSPSGKRKSGVETFLLSLGMHPVEAAGGYLPDSRSKTPHEQMPHSRGQK